MNKKKHLKEDTHKTGIMKSKPIVLFAAVASICLGIFFIVLQSFNKPIPRENAVFYSGEFLKYESSKNYCTIYLKDGSCYAVYPHTETKEFRNAMESLREGTELEIAVNPNNDYVVEIKTATEELLNFETSQKEIDSYDNGYIGLGIFLCAVGVFLISYVIVEAVHKREKKDRLGLKRENSGKATLNPEEIRRSEVAAKGKILLETNVAGYEICYRRVKFVNELVINGFVYDSIKGILEFEHKLCAAVDGHIIEAGLDENNYSYIMFDGDCVAYKERVI